MPKSKSQIQESLFFIILFLIKKRNFQTDPLERQFSQYRQMNGGRFLVSLREVLHSCLPFVDSREC